ncbi:MAG: hypothetical protein NTX65_13110 [Ignavibacteriales bacterium]|nr:hypothetical protein [Ignavibacteriales bacterium]
MRSFLNRILIFTSISLFFLNGFVLSQPKQFYVGTNGYDSNSGMLIEEPLRTINCAIGKAEAGDSVIILPGIYKEIINLNSKSGKPENPIYIKGFSINENEYPVIEGGAETPAMDLTNSWILLNNSNWIVVEKIKFINGWTYPINIKNSSYITFRSCRFFGGRRVISAGGIQTHHILVEKCFWDQGGDLLWHLVADKVGVDAWTSMHHGSMMYFNGSIIDFSGTGGSIVIRGNKIINAFNAVRWRGVKGLDANIEIYDNDISQVRDNDFEPEIYTYNLHVYHNLSHNVHRTMSVDNVEGGEVYYYGNVVTTDNDSWARTVCTGFWKIYGGQRKRSFPMYAFNNSFYGLAKAMRSEDELILFKHFNNAYFFTGDTAWYLYQWNDTNEFDYDISNRTWAKVFIDHNQENYGKISDIKFADPVKQNLILAKGSPGIDAGKIMSFPEFDWKQSFEGKAPDIGAYENNKLVEGPPFRFMIPPDGSIEYKEKPRIVRNYIDGNKVIIYFSGQIDPSSVKITDVALYKRDEKLKVESVSFPNNKYEMIVGVQTIPVKGDLSLSFHSMPLGINGEQATYWASTIKIHKSVSQ